MNLKGTTTQERRAAGFWPSVKEALRGSEQDFTEGNLRRAVVLLAIPMVLEMAMESLFAIVDVYFVSSLGTGAVAAVGLTESLLTIVYTIGMGMGMAATAMVARRIGEKDPEGAALAAVQAIGLGAGVSVGLGIAGWALAGKLLEAMGSEPEVVRAGRNYAAWVLGGSAMPLLLILINAIFRGAGDAAIAMRVLWLGNGLNILLDPVLIFGWGPVPALGVTGAGIATVVGRGIGVAYQIWILARGNGRVRIRRRHLRFCRQAAADLARVSFTGMTQFFIATASWIGLMRIVAVFGSAALAGYTIAIRIITFSILPAWGLSNAAATLVGQNLGAGKPDRAEKSVWLTALYNVGFLGVIGVLFLVFGHHFMRFFTAEAEVIRTGADCLRYVSYGYVFYAFGMVLVNAFNGAGDTWTPTVLNFFCFWLCELPLAWLLAMPLDHGPRGVFLSITVAESALAVVSLIVFRRGRWKTKRI